MIKIVEHSENRLKLACRPAWWLILIIWIVAFAWIIGLFQAIVIHRLYRTEGSVDWRIERTVLDLTLSSRILPGVTGVSLEIKPTDYHGKMILPILEDFRKRDAVIRQDQSV